ncbi:MAG TPA: AsmA family protein, partial [Hyphomicrobiaceae bacterium]|nr:AsmA family protein [Hyphomicrobiaceae bacterium]
TLAFHGSDGVERGRLDGINGELSAPALDGPYRLRASYTTADGGKREVRLSTGEPEGDGKVPFRLAIRRLDTRASYTLDARAADLMGKTRIEGALTARLPLAGAPSVAASESTADADPRETPLEVKSQLRADMTGGLLSDLTLTFDQGDRPQIVTGEVRAVWGTPVAIEMGLKSRWLDLDRLAGASGGIGPVASATRLAAWVRDLLPVYGQTRIGIAIEQAKLAGEAIGPVRLGLARRGDKLEISELRTTLPGGSRGDIKGSISGAGKALAFAGSIGVRGTSTARFVDWATGKGLSLAADADGPFDLRANLTIDPAQATVSDLNGVLAGTLLKGGGRYRWTGRPELALMLEGPKIDARSLLPVDLRLPDLFGILAGAASARQNPTRTSTAGNAVLRALQSDLDVQLKAGQLVTADRTYLDFIGAVTMKGGNLKQLKLRLSGDDGYNLQLDGKVDNLAVAPKGMLRGYVTAESAESIAPLAALLGVPAAWSPGDSRAREMVPLRLAGTLRLGARSRTSSDLVLDGEGNSGVVKIAARLDGSSSGWRDGRAEITASVEAGDAGKLTALLFPETRPPALTGAAKPGRILVRASGIPSEGLMSLVTIDSAGVAANFRGQVQLHQGGSVKADGDLEVQAGDGTVLATLVGLAPTLRADGVPVAARLKLALDGSAISMDKLALQLGERRLTGRIALAPAASGERRHVDAELGLNEISVATLLGPLLDLRFGAASAAEAALTGQQIPWPDEPFSASAFDAFEGQIKLHSKRLTLTDGMALDDARLHVVLQPGKIEAKEIVGTALGGKVKATARIEKAAAGAEVHGTLGFGIALEEIAGARPSKAAPEATAKAAGPVSGTLQFSGRGLSPRAVIAALQGTGSIAFDDATLPGLSPAAIATATEAALKAESGKLGTTLRQALGGALSAENLLVGQASYPLEIVDGEVRSKSLLVETDQGRTIGSARLDLNTLNLDSQWRLEARSADPSAKALPPAIVSYRAPISSLAAAQQQIDTTALEQELSARKIERDLEELEKWRRIKESDPANAPAAPAPLAPAAGQPAQSPLQPPLPVPAAPMIPPPAPNLQPATPG